MFRRWRLTVVMLGWVLCVAPAGADDLPGPDLKPLNEQVRKLVEKHYPKAKVTLDDGTIAFAFNTRKFMIHEPLKTGEWQDAFETTGPQRGGILGTIGLRPGRYGGAATVPQKFDVRYYTTLLMAPETRKGDAHLYVHLHYPKDTPEEFLKDFRALVDDFEKHLGAKGK
jgi:hypothetical protein